MESRHLITSEIRSTASQEMKAIQVEPGREAYIPLILAASVLIFSLVFLAIAL